MINNPKETEFPLGEEGNSSEIGKVNPKVSSSAGTANPTPWLRLRDPRIVRVSRVFGGKDRHSKVCTIRGLRDRRVRLSVPTAIQLYDLQDRLGLNQPSKVVDWLLNAAKHEIDELPPLPMPLAGHFSLLTPREANIAAAAASQSNNEGQGVILKNNNSNEMGAIEWELGSSSRPNFWTSTATATSSPTSSNALWRATSKEVARDNNERENWRSTSTTTTTRNEVEKGEGNEGGNSILQGNEGGNCILPQRTNNHPFFPGMLNNIAHVPNSANYRWELPNYQLLSHLGGNHGFKITSQTDHIQHLQNVMSPQPSTLSLSTGSPFMLCPPGIPSTSTTTQTYFPSQSSAANSVEIVDPRQVNHHFQMLSSNAAAQNLLPNPMMRPLYFGMSNSKQLVGFPPNDNIGSDQQQNKELE